MARPIFERLRNSSRTATSTTAPTTTVTSRCSIETNPPNGSNSKLPVGMPSSCVIMRLFSPPKMISPKPMRNSVMPMVAMNRMMSGWLTSGRSTTRSMLQASMYMTTSVSGNASQAGTPRSYRPTSVSAAKTTMMPCAKLKMRDDLKISTNPSAIRA